MKSYLITVLLVCALATVATMFSVEGKTKGYFRLLLSVVVLMVILLPLQGLEWEAPILPPGEEGSEAGEETSPIWEATEVALRESICATFGLERGWVLVQVTGESVGEETHIRKVEVTLLWEAREMRGDVLAFLKREIREGDIVVTV